MPVRAVRTTRLFVEEGMKHAMTFGRCDWCHGHYVKLMVMVRGKPSCMIYKGEPSWALCAWCHLEYERAMQGGA